MKIFRLLGLFTLLLTISCAGFWASMRSSSTTVVNKKAPYYTGKVRQTTGKIGHFPVEMDVRLYHDFFEKERRNAIVPLMEAMNDYLDNLQVGTPLAYIDLDPDKAPDVYLGNRDAFNSPVSVSSDEEEEENVMVLYHLAPGKEWKDSLLEVSQTNGVDYFIYVTIGFGEYFVRMKNLLGSKELQIGTGHKEDLAWMSDLDTPAEVLHVTGALLDKNGKILRCGAEGIVAKKTGFWTSVFGMQDVMNNKEIEAILNTVVREDLDGKPLAWQVALNNLVAQLLGDETMIVQ